jgi:DNA-3-methyladenine glycosylase I
VDWWSGAMIGYQEFSINTRAYLLMKEQGDDFSKFPWKTVGGKPVKNEDGERIAQSALSENRSRELKRRNFKFLWPVIVDAWMQAMGLVNDHAPKCFRNA